MSVELRGTSSYVDFPWCREGVCSSYQLLTALGSMAGVLTATEAQLVEAGATKRQAQAIKETLGGAGAVTPDAETAEEAAIENAFQPD